MNEETKIKIRRHNIIPMGVGIALGVSLGAAFDNIALGLVIGIVIGGIGVVIRKSR
jgi:large-conductance mechanosensitive channel